MSKLDTLIVYRGGHKTKRGGKYPCPRCGYHTDFIRTRKGIIKDNCRRCNACGWKFKID